MFFTATKKKKKSRLKMKKKWKTKLFKISCGMIYILFQLQLKRLQKISKKMRRMVNISNEIFQNKKDS